jgi:two-component system, sensor histidine kinase LadS
MDITSKKLFRQQWLESSGFTLFVAVSIIVIILNPAFHWIIGFVPNIPEDNLIPRLLSSAISIVLLLILWLRPSLRKYTDIFMIFTAMVAMISITYIVAEAQNHYLFVTIDLIAIFGASLAFLRAVHAKIAMFLNIVLHIGFTVLLNNQPLTTELFMPLLTIASASLIGAVFSVIVNNNRESLLQLQEQLLEKAGELTEANESLQDSLEEVKLLNSTLTERNDELQMLNMEKNEFLGIVAHDLKSPLSGIKGLSELLTTPQEMDIETITTMASTIYTTSDRMFSIITNLLDINAIETGAIRFEKQWMNPMECIERVCAEQETYASSKTMKLTLTTDGKETPIYSDPNALNEIIDNLVSNAVKYSYPNSEITIALTYNETNCSIAVTDQGQGISEEDQKQLYKKFAKLTARPTGSEHSTGLGLSIVKKMIELLGGTISCTSTVGVGSTFTIQLPTSTNLE